MQDVISSPEVSREEHAPRQRMEGRQRRHDASATSDLFTSRDTSLSGTQPPQRGGGSSPPSSSGSRSTLHLEMSPSVAGSDLGELGDIALMLKQKRLADGLSDVKSVLRRSQKLLDRKDAQIDALEARVAALQRALQSTTEERDEARDALRDTRTSVAEPLKQQVVRQSEEMASLLRAGRDAKERLDEALANGTEHARMRRIAEEQAEGLRVALEKLRSDYDVILAKTEANEAILGDFTAARNNQRGRHEQQLAALQLKYRVLEGQCEDVRRERAGLEDQLRQAQQRYDEAALQTHHRRLQASADDHRRGGEVQDLEEALHAAHINNCRLLRLLMETTEYAQVIEFSGGLNEFDFVRAPAMLAIADAPHDPRRIGTGISHCDLVSGAFHDPRYRTTRSKNVYLNGTKSRPGLKDEHQQILADAVADVNDILRRSEGGRLAVAASSACGPCAAGELIQMKSEGQFWIPHAAFVAAQRWRNEHAPGADIRDFFSFFVSLNDIWRQRLISRVEAHDRDHAQKAAKLAQQVKELRAREANKLVANEAELSALRREVRDRVQSKAALQLFQQYDQLLRTTLQRAQLSEQECQRIAELHRRAGRVEEPGLVVMRDLVDAAADTARRVSLHLTSRLGGASEDVRRFVDVVHNTAIDDSGALTAASILRRVLDFTQDFAAEVERQVADASGQLLALAGSTDDVVLRHAEMQVSAARASIKPRPQSPLAVERPQHLKTDRHGDTFRARSASARRPRRLSGTAHDYAYLPDEDDLPYR